MPARIRRVLMPCLPKMTIGIPPPLIRVCYVRTNVYASCHYCRVLYSCRRSAALCKMPLLTTDDSIITLRKSYYLGRAICRATPRRDVVALCMYVRARAHIIIIMMLLAIMKDSGIWRIHGLAPRATRVMHTIAKSLTYLYYVKVGVTRTRVSSNYVCGIDVIRCYAYQAERERESKLRRLARYQRISVNSRDGPDSSFCRPKIAKEISSRESPATCRSLR